ncbi:50S ribosomal protein L1 [candidate division WOR-1 bacterium RIFCSPLOWO2_02_FULL_46_20]|uniref:Large ribosomal subunit protein uL1 n=2 Tax=Saganbacteria TaxID=1703751 RepID=A0A1F4R542_UNCSA|nr:MAG: 50S ribosomal protein L1 [candidate division WOR-1 bacterium RIFCSPHIGHO2_02_FULL_45_12]OGC03284.1 MAG: 50S ribosomal protein L1 [candidate division WOR-1 bacterium RIFCSPLOWO2_02_FULL_46_20]OGC08930.1 MAG: 50S ribosomal protein L1 [candidate division WOR-1 bacterium RIFCSPLOWO2_12_FULL_45_9]
MSKRSKIYQEKVKLVDKERYYLLTDALQLIKQTARAKFDESIDLAMKLGADSKKHSVRGTVMLPGGSGKFKRVAVVARAEKVKEAEEAGAAIAGSDDLVEKIQKGFLDFDVLVVTPDMMGAVGKLGKILGPKGLMPNPKTGTVTFDIVKTVNEYKGGKVEFKMDKTGVLHMVLGKVSFDAAALEKNFLAALSAVIKVKPSGLKVNYIQSITISGTMGPGIKIDAKAAQEKVEVNV